MNQPPDNGLPPFSCTMTPGFPELLQKINGTLAISTYQAGKEGTVEIVLEAKKPFHVNAEYPIKFKVKEGPGVKYSAAVVGKDKAKLEEMRATMPVTFVPEAAAGLLIARALARSGGNAQNRQTVAMN